MLQRNILWLQNGLDFDIYILLYNIHHFAKITLLGHMIWYPFLQIWFTGPRSIVGNVSDFRLVSDCRSRDPEFDPGPVPYFYGDWSWNNFYGHSPPFCWLIQERLLPITNESMCTKYWLTAYSILPRKSVVRWTDLPDMTIAVDWDVKQQTNSKQKVASNTGKTLKKLASKIEGLR